MGGREVNVLRASRERGDPIPMEIQNRPWVWALLEPYWDAFWALSRSRQMVSTGMGATPMHLTYTDKSGYAKDHGMAETVEDLDDFLYLLDAMDDEWLKLNTPKAPASRRSRPQ